MQFIIAFNIMFKRMKAIRFMLKDKTVHLWKKALIVAGILYLLLPFNIFPAAWVGDLILWIWILWILRKTLDKYWMGDTVDYSSKFKSKEVIDNVDYEVKEESKKPRSGE
jgi:uncharacterized membrane protein YkvA (DUF1232 family)